MKMNYSETKPERSGKYLAKTGAGDYMTLDYSKKYQMWNVTDNCTQDEAEEFEICIDAWAHLEDVEKEEKGMEQKLVDYIEKYYELKYEFKLQQEELKGLRQYKDRVIFNAVKSALSYADHLNSWEYDSLLKNYDINEATANRIVNQILQERKAEKEAEADEN